MMNESSIEICASQKLFMKKYPNQAPGSGFMVAIKRTLSKWPNIYSTVNMQQEMEKS